jgi:hypothetical protein
VQQLAIRRWALLRLILALAARLAVLQDAIHTSDGRQ